MDRSHRVVVFFLFLTTVSVVFVALGDEQAEMRDVVEEARSHHRLNYHRQEQLPLPSPYYGLFTSRSTLPKSFRRVEDEESDAADLQKAVEARDRGNGWVLFCGRENASAPVQTFGDNNRPNVPRCFVHRRGCGERFKVFAYPAVPSLNGTSSGPFHRALTASLGTPRLAGRITSSLREACFFLPGLDLFLFGNAKGYLPGSPDEGDALIDAYSQYGVPPYAEWVNGLRRKEVSFERGKRSLVGLNHIALGFSDWHVDQERSFSNRGMLPARSSTPSDAFTPGVDVNIPLPKVVNTTAFPSDLGSMIPGSQRPNLLFFSGSVYDLKSPRYYLRHLREGEANSRDVRIWLYCYDKTKGGKKRSAVKWEKLKKRCAHETSRAEAAGFMPGFKKRGGTFMPPPVYTDPAAAVYVRETRNATFCPIVRGWGFHSYRLTEALYYGCIPVIFEPGPLSPTRSDSTYLSRFTVRNVLPFSDIIEWDRVALFASEDDLYVEPRREELLARMRRFKANAAAVDLMQRLGKAAHDEVLGGSDLHSSMAIMLNGVFQTLEYRAKLYDRISV